MERARGLPDGGGPDRSGRGGRLGPCRESVGVGRRDTGCAIHRGKVPRKLSLVLLVVSNLFFVGSCFFVGNGQGFFC